MNKALFAAAVAALGAGTACQAEDHWQEQAGDESETVGTTTEAQELVTPTITTTPTTSISLARPKPVPICEPSPGINPLDHRLAAIATLTLQCGHSFNITSFSFQTPLPYPSKDAPLTVLWPTFECQDPRAKEALTNVLGLQYIEGDRAGALAYFAKQWRGYQARMRQQQLTKPQLCPTWTASPVQTGTPEYPNGEDIPTDELLKELTQEKREGEHAKSHFYWKISATPEMADQGCRSNRCVLNRAKVCSSAFGNRFWETAFTAENIVKTDPNYWDDNTFYGSPDFFDFGWVHQMATSTGWPPGDLWGAPMRSGEVCTYYHSNNIDVLTGSLNLVQCAPGWFCATECKVATSTTTSTATSR